MLGCLDSGTVRWLEGWMVGSLLLAGSFFTAVSCLMICFLFPASFFRLFPMFWVLRLCPPYLDWLVSHGVCSWCLLLFVVTLVTSSFNFSVCLFCLLCLCFFLCFSFSPDSFLPVHFLVFLFFDLFWHLPLSPFLAARIWRKITYKILFFLFFVS